MFSIAMSSLYVLICFLLLVVVLLQQGKGGDIASAFGGSGSQAAFGARAGATVLTRATTVLGALFMVGAMFLAIVGQRGPGSLLSGIDAPVETVPAEEAPVEEPPDDSRDRRQVLQVGGMARLRDHLDRRLAQPRRQTEGQAPVAGVLVSDDEQDRAAGDAGP